MALQSGVAIVLEPWLYIIVVLLFWGMALQSGGVTVFRAWLHDLTVIVLGRGSTVWLVLFWGCRCTLWWHYGFGEWLHHQWYWCFGGVALHSGGVIVLGVRL